MYRIIVVVVGIITYILAAMGFFRMFKKAGRPAWMAWVPIFDKFACFKMAWNTLTFWIYLVCYFVYEVFNEAVGTPRRIIAAVTGIVYIVYLILMSIKTAQAFGKGVLCGIMLYLFPFVTGLYLGYGSAEYVGNLSEEA